MSEKKEMHDALSGFEIVEAVGEHLQNMEERLNEQFNQVNTRLDRIEKRLDELEAGQSVIAQRLFQSEKDIELLKRVK